MANPYQTPESFDFDQTDHPAPRWMRLTAFLIDAVIFLFLFLGIGIVFLAYFEMFFLNRPFVLLVIATFGAAFCHVVLNWHGWKTRGQSFGKQATGISIVRKNGDSCSIGRILARTVPIMLIVVLIPVVGPILGFLDTVCIFHGKRRCLHDELADTAVIRLALPKNPSLPAA